MKVFAWIAYCAAIGLWLIQITTEISAVAIAVGAFSFLGMTLLLQMYEGVP